MLEPAEALPESDSEAVPKATPKEVFGKGRAVIQWGSSPEAKPSPEK